LFAEAFFVEDAMELHAVGGTEGIKPEGGNRALLLILSNREKV
jgi:hypothetical protein